MSWIIGLITGAIGLLRRFLDRRRDAAIKEQGRLETREAQSRETLKAAEEARRAEDDVRKLPDAAVDDELRQWSRKPGGGQ